MVKSVVIYLDTSAHFALINKKDVEHTKAQNFLVKTKREAATLVTSHYIVGETYTLLRRKMNYSTAMGYIEDLPRLCRILRVEPQDEKRAWQIIKSHDDKEFSYVDATSFAVMERLGLKTAFAFDRHFAQYGFQVLPEERG